MSCVQACLWKTLKRHFFYVLRIERIFACKWSWKKKCLVIIAQKQTSQSDTLIKRMKSRMIRWICSINVIVYHVSQWDICTHEIAWILIWFLEFVRWMWTYFAWSQCDVHETHEIWKCTMNVNLFHIESMWCKWKWKAWNFIWFSEFVRWMWMYFTLSQRDVNENETPEISYDLLNLYDECECISHWVNVIHIHMKRLKSHQMFWSCTMNVNLFLTESKWYTYTWNVWNFIWLLWMWMYFALSEYDIHTHWISYESLNLYNEC